MTRELTRGSQAKREMRNLLLPEIQVLLEDDKLDVLKEFCEESHPADVADALEGLDPEQLQTILSLVSPETAAEIFGHIEDHEQVKFADAVDAKTVASLVEEMHPDDSADLLRELDEEDAAEILRHVPHDEREEVELITSYPEDTAGAIMTTEFASLRENLTADEALSSLRQEAPDKDTIYTI